MYQSLFRQQIINIIFGTFEIKGIEYRKTLLRQHRSAWIWSGTRQWVWRYCKAGNSWWAGVIRYADGAAKSYTWKNQRQSHRVDEPRRTRRVLPGFFVGWKADDWRYERQVLRHPILPCVAQIKSAQSYPNKPNKSLTGDLSRFVGQNWRQWKQRWMFPLPLLL